MTILCKAAQEKQDKKAKKRKNGSILNFLKPKATIVPLMVNSTAPVHSYKLPLQSEPHTTSIASTTNVQGKIISSMSQPASRLISNSFIKMLQELVKDLPESRGIQSWAAAAELSLVTNCHTAWNGSNSQNGGKAQGLIPKRDTPYRLLSLNFQKANKSLNFF